MTCEAIACVHAPPILIVMAGLDPAIPLSMAQPCPIIGIAGSSPAMTESETISSNMLYAPPSTLRK